jgi:hypothetical protein
MKDKLSKESTALSAISPANLIQSARNAHPAFKYAIVIGGLCGIIATVYSFGLSPATLVFGVIILICLMVVFVVFARVATLAAGALAVPATILVYTVLALLVRTTALLFTSAFFDIPLPFKTTIVHSFGATTSAPGPSAPNLNNPEDRREVYKKYSEHLDALPPEQSLKAREFFTRLWLKSKDLTVTQLKALLNRLGYYHGALDDTFDLALADSIILFQKEHNLQPADGIAGEYTIAKLQELAHAIEGKRPGD